MDGRREVDEILGTTQHELTTVKAVVEGLTCSEIFYSVSATNRDDARGELGAPCKDTFRTEEKCPLNTSFGAIGQRCRSAFFDHPGHNVGEGDASLGRKGGVISGGVSNRGDESS